MEKIGYPKPVDFSLFQENTNDPIVKYGLPSKTLYCKSCVISNQRPSSAVEYEHTKESKKSTINFDENGICDACNLAKKKNESINWLDREAELKDLCDKHRKDDGSYDCIVPGSGGRIVFMLRIFSKRNTGCIR